MLRLTPIRPHNVASHNSRTVTVLDPPTRRARSIQVVRGPHGVAVAFVPY